MNKGRPDSSGEPWRREEREGVGGRSADRNPAAVAKPTQKPRPDPLFPFHGTRDARRCSNSSRSRPTPPQRQQYGTQTGTRQQQPARDRRRSRCHPRRCSWV